MLADSRRSDPRKVARILSRHRLSGAVRSSLEGSYKCLRGTRHSALLIHENVAKGPLIDPCRMIRGDDPDLVIVVRLAKMHGATEERLFDVGVDDVVTDHSTPRVIVRRILHHLEGRSAKGASRQIVHVGSAVVDMERMVVWQSGRARKITPGVMELLKFILANRGVTITTKSLSESLWADSVVDPDGNNLAMQIGKLRRLLEVDPKNPQLIQTIRGVGYTFHVPRRSRPLKGQQSSPGAAAPQQQASDPPDSAGLYVPNDA